jgi:hypothetical protein
MICLSSFFTGFYPADYPRQFKPRVIMAWMKQAPGVGGIGRSNDALELSFPTERANNSTGFRSHECPWADFTAWPQIRSGDSFLPVLCRAGNHFWANILTGAGCEALLTLMTKGALLVSCRAVTGIVTLFHAVTRGVRT